MRLLKFATLLLAFWLSGCTTTGNKTSGKPYDFCICGPTIDAEGKPHCAIWGEAKTSGQAMKAFASEQRPGCEASDCSQLFSKSCQRIQMSAVARPQAPAPANSCYCDALLLENDKGQVTLHCAAWAEDGKNLIEYYALDDCSPTRCNAPPFNLAPKVCKNAFKPFYAPLLNRR